MSTGVFSWWCFLCVIGALNVIAWSLSGAALRRHQGAMSSEAYAACQRQLVLSAIYVFGCAFRSVLPVFDIPRLVLFDVWLSSAFVGRTVATAAELAFVAQWALLLRHTARATHSALIERVSRVIFPLIVAAEVCSWYSVLTTSNLGHVIEEALWGVSALLAVVAMAVSHPRCPGRWRPALLTGVIAGVPYAAYMFYVDVPMYWSRWIADEASGRVYLTLTQGVMDAFERRVVAHDWSAWQSEVVWMSLYFSVAVWISISLVHAAMRQLRTRAPVATGRRGQSPGSGRLPS
jgi:hypothetical protein